MSDGNTGETQGPVAKLALELAGALVCYLGVFVIGPALADPTSTLRLKLDELRDEVRSLRDDFTEARFRVQIENLERSLPNA